MNIIVKPYGSKLCYCRPDTTWERENRDFYSPECVNEVLWTPVVFARVSKAGKCIGKKFASRYYDGLGCGMLMYCALPEISSCVDHTSILPMPLYSPVVLEEEKVFEVCRNGEVIAVLSSNAASELMSTDAPDDVMSTDAPDDVMSTDAPDDVMSTERSEWRHLLEEALCNASKLTSLRIGDFVTVELAPAASLARQGDKEVAIKGTFCDNETFNFKMHL